MSVLGELDRQENEQGSVLAALGQAAPRGPSGLLGRAVEALPDIGGAVGGLLTSPLKLAGPPGLIANTAAAGLGGALGETGRQLLTGEPGLDNPGAIAGQAGIQAGSELAGGLLFRGAGMLARPLMRRALRPAKTLMAEYRVAAKRITAAGLEAKPDLIQAVIEQRGKVGKVVHSGTEQATKLRQEAARETHTAIRRATVSGVRFRTAGVLANLQSLEDEARAIGDVGTLREINRVKNQISRSNPGSISPSRLDKIRRIAMNRARPVIAAINQGSPPDVVQTARARAYHAIGSAAREQLATLPDVAKGRAVTQQRILAERAITRAEDAAPVTVRPGVFNSVAYNVGTAGGLADNPALASRLALMFADPVLQSFLRQTPRAVHAAYRQGVYEDQ